MRHVVFLSVAGAERRSWVPHRKVEVHLEKVGTAWTILRPGFFAQNLADAYKADIVEDHRLYVPAGDGKVAFLDVRDIGAVTAEIFTRDAFRGRALTLTGPEAVTFSDVARLLTEILATPIRYEPASVLGYAVCRGRNARCRPSCTSGCVEGMPRSWTPRSNRSSSVHRPRCTTTSLEHPACGRPRARV